MAPITSTLKPDAPAWVPGQPTRNDEGTQSHAFSSSASMWDAPVPEGQYQHHYAPNSAPSPSMSQQQQQQQHFAPPEYGSSTPFTGFHAQTTPVPLFVPRPGDFQQQQGHGSHFYPSAQVPAPYPFYQDQHFQHQPPAHAWHPHTQQASFVHPQDPYAHQLYLVENTRLGSAQMYSGNGDGNGSGREHVWKDSNGDRSWKDAPSGYGAQRQGNGNGYKGKKGKKGGKKWKGGGERKWGGVEEKENREQSEVGRKKEINGEMTEVNEKTKIEVNGKKIDGSGEEKEANGDKGKGKEKVVGGEKGSSVE